jgi:pyruvate dehydrogenase E1 component
MPDFWSYPTVSMGLGGLSAIYQARFNRYLHNRGLADTARSRVWCFLGDGELDEPETVGALSVAAREGLDNLVFVVNANLQRLDGPVRGNASVIRELEGIFRGAGWNVLKVLWASEWDELFERDTEGHLVRRLSEMVDGDMQRLSVAPGAEIREELFNTPELRALVEHLSDDDLAKLRRGGHDRSKVYAAFMEAVDGDHPGVPTVILAHTVKGYGMGPVIEAKNTAHQQKSLKNEDLHWLRDRWQLPLDDAGLEAMPYLSYPEDSPEVTYLRERRQALGGPMPVRKVRAEPLEVPTREDMAEAIAGSDGREVSTTMAFVRMLTKLLRHPTVGKLCVPIIPDEARTFGMDAMFRAFGIYAPFGQQYTPIDRKNVLYYREATDGQILEEGINEAGSLASFIAAGTAYAAHGVNTIPFYVFYSMFGFQRVMDLIWACADMRGKGFLCGATAGRTTLNGEGLQHEDGHSHLLAAAVPGIKAYDPAYGYETALIVQDGIRRMYQEDEPGFYYLTLYNENYAHPAPPEGCEEGVLKGMYKLSSREAKAPKTQARAQLFGSGTILGEVLRAQEVLAEEYGVASDVWSVTSYQQLRVDALSVERWNRLHPDQAPRTCYVQDMLTGQEGPFVASSDYLALVAEQIAAWVPGKLHVLGTDGFGRSDTRPALRHFFEVSTAHVVFATLSALVREGKLDASVARDAQGALGIDPDCADPVTR